MKHGTSAFISTAKTVKLSEKSDTEHLLQLYGGGREGAFCFYSRSGWIVPESKVVLEQFM